MRIKNKTNQNRTKRLAVLLQKDERKPTELYNVVLCEIQGTQYFYLYKKTMIFFYVLEQKIGGTRDQWALMQLQYVEHNIETL